MTDLAGAMVELYAYDAYGNAIGFDPAEALTEFLYSGEQFDAKIGQQYLRQRYYDPSTGRFNRLDPFFGNHADPQSFHKYLYTHADPVNLVDPSGLFGGLIGIGISTAIGGNMQGNNSRVQAASYARSVSTIQKFQRVYDIMDRMMNLMDTVDGVMDIIAGGPGIFFDMLTTAALSHVNFLNALQTVVPNGRVKGEIPLPESLVKWLHRKTDGVASANIVSEVIGTIATNFLARAVGMETVSLKLAYRGIDAIYRFPIKGINTYIIAESKGGNSRLKMTSGSGMQMHDGWIDKSIDNLTKGALVQGSELYNLRATNVAKTPMIAVIVKLNLHRKNPEIDFAVQFYRGVTDWGTPFE